MMPMDSDRFSLPKTVHGSSIRSPYVPNSPVSLRSNSTRRSGEPRAYCPLWPSIESRGNRLSRTGCQSHDGDLRIHTQGGRYNTSIDHIEIGYIPTLKVAVDHTDPRTDSHSRSTQRVKGGHLKRHGIKIGRDCNPRLVQ